MSQLLTILKMKMPGLKLLIIITCLVIFNQITYSQVINTGASIKQEVMKAFGGEAAMKQVKELTYTLEKGKIGGAKTKERVTIYFRDVEVKQVFSKEGVAITRLYSNGRIWEKKNGNTVELPKEQSKKLSNLFFYNFIGLLKDDLVKWKFIKSTTYRQQPVRIVRVSNEQYQLDLFINRQGEIVTSASPKVGPYLYYADEFEYKSIGKGIRFPLVFKVAKDGKYTYKGKFKEVEVAH